jgi:hypothetical protein
MHKVMAYEDQPVFPRSGCLRHILRGTVRNHDTWRENTLFDFVRFLQFKYLRGVWLVVQTGEKKKNFFNL